MLLHIGLIFLPYQFMSLCNCVLVRYFSHVSLCHYVSAYWFDISPMPVYVIIYLHMCLVFFCSQLTLAMIVPRVVEVPQRGLRILTLQQKTVSYTE